MAPVPRLTARVLPVSPVGEVLLLQDRDPARPGVLRWGTIGGAVEPGESLRLGAVRELREETGIVVEDGRLGEPFHHNSYVFSWAGTDYLSEASYFAFPLAREVTVSFAFLEPAEVGNVVAAGWWSPDELDRDGTAVSSEIPDIMRAAVAAVAAT